MLKLSANNKIPGDATVLGGGVKEKASVSKGGSTKVAPGLGDTKNKFMGGSVKETCEDETTTQSAEIQWKGGNITPLTIGSGKASKDC